MNEKADISAYPTWVKLSLWGLGGRSSVLGFVCISLLAAIGLVAYAVRSGDARFYAGAGFLAAALLYWRAVVWVDRNGRWPE